MSKIKYIVMILMLTVAMSLSGCGSEEKAEVLLNTDQLQKELQNAQNPNYKTVTVRKGEYVRARNGSAALAYMVREDLVWEKNNARFQEILVTRGQEVKQGEVLAVFEIEESKTHMKELQMQLDKAKKSFEEEKADRLEAIKEAQEYAEIYYRYQELDAANLKIEMQKADYEQYVLRTEQQITSLEESIKNLKDEVSENTLKAPFDGVISAVTVYHPGDQVEPGAVLISMYSTDKILIVTEDKVNQLRYNMDVKIHISYKKEKKELEGIVVATPDILPDGVSQRATMIQLKEDIAPEDLQGNITYVCDSEVLQDVLLVDRDAVSKEDNKNFVYILEDGSVQKRFIVTGPNNNDEVVVYDGLVEGQVLVID